MSFELNDETAENGFYMCKIFPYFISNQTVLQIEVTKAFQLELFGEIFPSDFCVMIFLNFFHLDPMHFPPPVMLESTPSQYFLPINSQIILQCKCRTHKKPTSIKWFRKKAVEDNMEHTYQSFVESSHSIKYFENFYEPLVSPGGQKELEDNILLSKLTVDVTQSSVYVCVAINYFGFSFHESFVNVTNDESKHDYEEEEDETLDYQEKNYEILFLTPLVLVLLLPICMIICTILYLLIRQILKRNKKCPETISL
jgi:hypothetical protein